jgi:antitoxin ChpS
MEIVLRKWGNSTVAVLPPVLLKALDLAAGQAMTLNVTSSGQITLSSRCIYTLEKLVTMCDAAASKPADLALWDTAKPIGNESW